MRSFNIRMAGMALAVAGLGFSFQSRAAFDHSHAILDGLLHKYVANGRVDYDGLKKDMPKLQEYLDQVARVSKADYDAFSTNQKKAYWINAYNAFTLKIVTDFYPNISSIKDISGKLPGLSFGKSKQWKVDHYKAPSGQEVKFIAAGKARSLDEIEHEILRPQFKDARVHAAIVCASKGCPPLINQVFTPEKLDQLLDQNMRNFLSDGVHNKYDAAKNQLFLSSIFKWFKEDFEKSAGSQMAFIKKYLPADVASKVTDKTEVTYLDYDWSLNKKGT